MGENKFRTHDIVSEEKNSYEYSRYSPEKVSKRGGENQSETNKKPH